MTWNIPVYNKKTFNNELKPAICFWPFYKPNAVQLRPRAPPPTRTAPPTPSAITVRHFSLLINIYLLSLAVFVCCSLVARCVPHQKTQTIVSATLSLSLSLSFLLLSLSFFLVSVHSGSHLVFLILFYISSCTLSPSLPLSLSLPPIHGSTTYTHRSIFFLKGSAIAIGAALLPPPSLFFSSAPLPPLARSPNEKLTEYVMRTLPFPRARRPTHTYLQTHARRRHATDSSQRKAVRQSEATMRSAARAKQRETYRERGGGRDACGERKKRGRVLWTMRVHVHLCVCETVAGRGEGFLSVSLLRAMAVNYLTRLAFLKQCLWNVVSLRAICVSAGCNNWTGLRTCALVCLVP